MSLKIKKPKKQYYLDGAATTPLSKEVVLAMKPYWQDKFGNPSSLYKPGREAKTAIDHSRVKVAEIINARPQEVIFTAGGTESTNLAIFGVARQWQIDNRQKTGHLIISSVEHDAVTKSAEALKQEGWKVDFVRVDKSGFVDLQDFKNKIRPNTILVSVMYANNEIGTVQPIQNISKILTEINKTRLPKKLPKILFHTDACQAAGFLSLDTQKLGVDLMTVNGSKLGGPKQTGILFKKYGVNLRPIIFGGGQEFGLRSGTENVPGIVGFAKALELTSSLKMKGSVIAKLVKLQSQFNDRLIKKVNSLSDVQITLNGPQIDRATKNTNNATSSILRLPNNLSYTIEDIEGESLMIYLDAKGISVATGSACSTTSNDPSHVLLAIGKSPKEAKETLRISLYEDLTGKDIDYITEQIHSSILLIK